MAGINPFARRDEPKAAAVKRLSGFERLPQDYRDLCAKIGKMWKRSPQNRRVREAADNIMAMHRQKNK